MSFFSRFPFFDKDEIAPDIINVPENVDIDFGRVIARLSAFSPRTKRFMFGRADGSGRLLVSQQFYNNPNVKTTNYVFPNGAANIVQEREDRQFVNILWFGVSALTVYAGGAGLPIYQVVLNQGDSVLFTSFTMLIDGNNAGVAGNIQVSEG